MNTFIIAFPSGTSVRRWAFFVHPAEFGARPSAREPWMWAEHLATQFPTQEAAGEALAFLQEATPIWGVHAQIGEWWLARRLGEARIIPAAEVPAGVRLAAPSGRAEELTTGTGEFDRMGGMRGSFFLSVAVVIPIARSRESIAP